MRATFEDKFLRASMTALGISAAIIGLPMFFSGFVYPSGGVFLGLTGALSGLFLQYQGKNIAAARVFLGCNALGMLIAAGVEPSPESVGTGALGYALLACFATLLLRYREFIAYGILCELFTLLLIARVELSIPSRTSKQADIVAITFVATAFFVLGLITKHYRESISKLVVAEQQAQEASKTKSRFLANMSHELRTPLNAILGYCELLSDDAEPQSEIAHDLERIHSSGVHLLGLINSLLDLTKIEVGEMQIYVEVCDLIEVVHDVVERLHPLATARGNQVEITLESKLTVATDITKVRQILMNLLSNANKFTEKGHIKITGYRHEGHTIVEVIDTGIGVSPDHLAQLFRPFRQADASTTRRYGGTGLGLALVKEFTELLGGTVTVTSTEGIGSTFSFSLVDLPLSIQTNPRIHRTVEPVSSEPMNQNAG